MDTSIPPSTHAQKPHKAATLVPNHRRLAFLPKSFGQQLMLRGEKLVYLWLERLCESYKGGYWHYYELPNDGFYLAPDLPGKLVICAENGFEDELSPDAAGIVATLYALNQLVAENASTPQAHPLIERYDLLRDFSFTHAEAGLILAAID